MASKYSIVQYVPNPIADERINIGVVAFNEDKVCVRFLRNWERVRSFGMEDIDFLKDFARRMNEAASSGLLFPGDRPDGSPRHERLTKITQSWINSIQFTEPRGSLDNLESLVEDIAQSYLIESFAHKPKFRDRKEAARIARSTITKVIQKYFKNGHKELIKDYPVRGSHKEHKFDIVVANDKPIFAAHGLSFEVHVPPNLQDSISWMISDVKELNPKFPLAIVALPPKQEATDYEKLERIYQDSTSIYAGLGADVLLENQVESWVSQHSPFL